MRSFWLAAAIGCAAVVLAGGSAWASVSTSNWAQNGGGATRHASNPTERVLGRFNVAKLTLQGTRINADGGGLLRPIIDSGTVFTIVRQSAGNAIEAFTESGTPLWTTDFTAAFENNFAIGDGVIVAADFYGSLYGIDEATGQQLWSAPSGGTSAQPVIANGVVYVDYGHIQALDLHTGNVLWTGQAIDTQGYSGPTVWGNEVFIYLPGTMYAFDTGDGHLLWSSPCAGVNAQKESSPMVLNGVVFDGAGCALDAVSGTSVWSGPVGQLNETTDATGGSQVFAGYRSANSSGQFARFEALNPTTGHANWHRDFTLTNMTDRVFGEGPIVAHGVVYITDQTHSTNSADATTIRAFSTKTGRQIWHSKQFHSGIWGVSVADSRLWAIIGTNVRYFSLS
jgi:outer membrane protein assembly factor BamB